MAIRQYLRNHGHYCAAVNITRYRKEESDELYYPQGAPELIGTLIRKRYDIVHLHIGGILPIRVALLALVCASIPWSKSILTFHSGGYPSSEEGRGVHRGSFRAFVFRRFDGLIAVNQEIANFFLRLGSNPSRVRIIAPHSVAITKVAETLPDPLASFFAGHNPVLSAVCGLEPEYDLSRQIDALGEVLSQFPNAGLAILGSGSLEADVRGHITSKGYAEHILLCGDVPHDATLKAIAESAVMLRTTLYDGDAISVREALYLGTPVIATDNGMRPDGVDLIPVGDTPALASAISKRLAMSKLERRNLESDEANLAAVLDLYHDALNG